MTLGDVPEAKPGPRPRRWPAAVAALVAAGAHLPGVRNGFTYDDFTTVLGNPTIRQPGNWLALLLHMRFRPVVNVSYALDYALSGEAPLGYHLVNLLLHAAVAAVFTVIAQRLWVLAGAGPRADWAALAGGLLSAVHPLATQAVGYVSARSELLSGLFLVLGLAAAQRAMAKGRSRATWGAVLAAFALAAASKEPGAMLPFLALLMARLFPGEDGGAWVRARGPLGVLSLAALLAGVGRLVVLAIWEPVPQGVVQNLGVQVQVLWRYLRLFVLPWGQSLVHAFREVDASTAPLAMLAGVALVALAGAAVAARRRAPVVTLGLGWFFLCMAPSTLVPLAEPMSEHRVYVAMLGLCLAASAPLALADAPWIPGRPRRAVLAAAAALLVVLGGLTQARYRVWSSPRALWAEAAARAPGVWAAQYGSAQALLADGDCAAAVEPFRAALGLLPGEVGAHLGLAQCLATLGRPREAFEVLEAAAAARPEDGRVWANLGALAHSQGAPRRALAYLERAVALEPANSGRRARAGDLARWLEAHADAPEGRWPPARP